MIWVTLFVVVGAVVILASLAVLVVPDKVFRKSILSAEYDLLGCGPRAKRALSPMERSFNEAVNRMIYTVDEKLRAVRVWFAIILLLLGFMMVGTGAALF